MPNTGLPFKHLPGAEAPTPGSMLSMQFQKRANELQQNFASQWKTVTRKSGKIGRRQTDSILQNIVKQAQQEAQALQGEYTKQSRYLQSIDRLQAAGLISNADELKWKATMGSDVSRSMYPDEPKTKTPMQQAHNVSRDVDMVDEELGNFRMGSDWTKFGQRDERWFSKVRPGRSLQVYNPDTDDWEKASEVQKAYHQELQTHLKSLLTTKQQLLRGGALTRAAVRMVEAPDSHAGFTERTLAYKQQTDPTVQNKEGRTAPTRIQLLDEYRRLGGKSTKAGREFADQYLR